MRSQGPSLLLKSAHLGGVLGPMNFLPLDSVPSVPNLAIIQAISGPWGKSVSYRHCCLICHCVLCGQYT